VSLEHDSHVDDFPNMASPGAIVIVLCNLMSTICCEMLCFYVLATIFIRRQEEFLVMLGKIRIVAAMCL
jgi:hypothetical protein